MLWIVEYIKIHSNTVDISNFGFGENIDFIFGQLNVLCIVFRFHNADHEPSMDKAVLPSIRDDIQLSVEIYRNKLYELIASRKNRVRNHVARASQNNHRSRSNNNGEETKSGSSGSSRLTRNSSALEVSSASHNRQESESKASRGNGSRHQGHSRTHSTNIADITNDNNLGVDEGATGHSRLSSNGARVRSNSVSTPLHRSRSEIRSSNSSNILSSSMNSQMLQSHGAKYDSDISPLMKDKSPSRSTYLDANKNYCQSTHDSSNFQNANDQTIKVKVVARKIDSKRTSKINISVNQSKEQKQQSSPNQRNRIEKTSNECLSSKSSSGSSLESLLGTKSRTNGVKRQESPFSNTEGTCFELFFHNIQCHSHAPFDITFEQLPNDIFSLFYIFF